MDDCLAILHKLENRLLSLGYQHFQLEQIKNDAMEFPDIANLPEGEKQQAVIETLKWYIDFAELCLRKVSNKTKGVG